VTSNYTNIDLAADSHRTFNEPSDKTSTFTVFAGGTSNGLFIYGPHALRFEETYVAIGGTAPCVTLFNDSSGARFGVAKNLDATLHCEGSSTTTFSIVSKTAASSPFIYGLRYRDHVNFATGTIFALGANTSSVVLFNPVIEIPDTIATPALFSSSNFQVVHPIIALEGSGITGWQPTSAGTCTGIGAAGTCVLNAASKITDGLFTLTTDSSGTAASGAVGISIPYKAGAVIADCSPYLINGTAAWPSTSTIVSSGVTTTGQQFNWNTNGAAVNVSKTLLIGYVCHP
jgi:hypothetical protein